MHIACIALRAVGVIEFSLAVGDNYVQSAGLLEDVHLIVGQTGRADVGRRVVLFAADCYAAGVGQLELTVALDAVTE